MSEAEAPAAYRTLFVTGRRGVSASLGDRLVLKSRDEPARWVVLRGSD
jgi:hypothetical protein